MPVEMDHVCNCVMKIIHVKKVSVILGKGQGCVGKRAMRPIKEYSFSMLGKMVN